MKNKYFVQLDFLKLNEYELEKEKLSLYNFLKYFNIDLIRIDLDNIDLEKCNYENIQNFDNEMIIEFFENQNTDIDSYDLENLNNYDNSKLNELLDNYYYDFINYHCIEYFQYFLVNEYDLDLLKEYCNYDILYDHNKDQYILCIDHLGISFSLVFTDYPLKELPKNYIFEDIQKVYKLFENQK